MKSNKQRRAEIMAARQRKITRAQIAKSNQRARALAPSEIAVNRSALQQTTLLSLPLVSQQGYYVSWPFTCRDCGSAECWSARAQQWWYEVMKGHPDSIAVRCRTCREKERQRRMAARRASEAGWQKKQELKHGKN